MFWKHWKLTLHITKLLIYTHIESFIWILTNISPILFAQQSEMKQNIYKYLHKALIFCSHISCETIILFMKLNSNIVKCFSNIFLSHIHAVSMKSHESYFNVVYHSKNYIQNCSSARPSRLFVGMKKWSIISKSVQVVKKLYLTKYILGLNGTRLVKI